MAKMKEKKELLPELRFPEFEGEWENKKLDLALKPISRKRVKPQKPYLGLGLRSHGKGTFLKIDESPEKNSMEFLYEVEENDLILNITFAWEGAIAIAENDANGALVSHRFPTFLFRKDTAIPAFFRYTILDKLFIYQLGVISPGGAGRNRVLNKKDFLKLGMCLPAIKEQQKIADCLGSLDGLIAARSAKLAALQDHKKGLLQQLFPAPGQTTPKRRFPEFEGEWKTKRLKDLGKLIPGLTYTPDDVREQGLLVLRSSNVQEGVIALEDNVFVDPQVKRANLSKPNDILICVRNGSKSLIGKNALIPNGLSKCTHGAFMTVFRTEFWSFVFQLFQTESYRNQVAADLGATINSINGAQFLKYRFLVPEPPEQQKIADCLSSLDALITAETDHITALQQHKKGLMQKLFPNPERSTKA